MIDLMLSTPMAVAATIGSMLTKGPDNDTPPDYRALRPLFLQRAVSATARGTEEARECAMYWNDAAREAQLILDGR